MTYLYLIIAICAEVTATSFMKQSESFTLLLPAAIAAFGYCVSFYFLSLVLRVMPTGVAYAIWSGIGIILIGLVARIFQGQRLDLPAMIGMGFIIAGVLVINLFSTTTQGS